VLLTLTAVAAALVAQHQLTAGLASRGGAAMPPVTVPAPVLVVPGWGVAGPAAQTGTVALTFTAGSGVDLAPQITMALRRLGVPGTFFVQPGQAARQRAVIQQQVATGDDVGVAWPTLARMPGWWLAAALTSAQYRLQRAGDPAAALVRVPGAATVTALGRPTWAAAQRLAQLGYVTVLADRSAQAARRPGDVLRALWPGGLDPPGHRPGLVLALSDTGRPGQAALGALPRLVAAILGSGYRFATVSAAFRLTIRPTRVSALSAAGAAAALRGGQLAISFTTALEWIFLGTAGLILARLILLLVTGVQHKWRDRRPRPPCREPVSVIIPAYNERAGIIRCLRSMLFCDYPSTEVILVDDGSTDGTADLVQDLGLPVTVVRQRNAGKAAALRAGIRRARHDLLVLADGDTVFEPTTISALVAPFGDPRVGAVAGNVKVANRQGLLGHIQYTEYVLGSSLDRRMYDVLGCMVTIPGAVGAFRREAIAGAGGVPGSTLAEDTDLTLAIGEAGWRVRYAAQARGWTEAPATVRQLWTQRHRWAYGTLQSLWKHRGTVLSPSGRWALAWIGLPYLFLTACALPLVSAAADVFILVEAWAAPWRAVALGAGLIAVQGTLALAAFLLDREPLRYLWTLPVQQLVYRQLIYLVVFHSMATAATGVRLRWHKLPRAGVELPGSEVSTAGSRVKGAGKPY
jgi:cellulose synthase/poly-beta-1,6-N-acetylglucosamine synthase-like glycosyltransferase/peptidoglycan/xylan/chitin deacetylase (PgdA/CDA1 family)